MKGKWRNMKKCVGNMKEYAPLYMGRGTWRNSEPSLGGVDARKWDKVWSTLEPPRGRHRKYPQVVFCARNPNRLLGHSKNIKRVNSGFWPIYICSGTWKNSELYLCIESVLLLDREAVGEPSYISCGTWKNSELFPLYRPGDLEKFQAPV